MRFWCLSWLKDYVQHLFFCHGMVQQEIEHMMDYWSFHVSHLMNEACHLYVVVVMVINIIHDKKLLCEANAAEKVLTALSLVDKFYNDISDCFLHCYARPVFTQYLRYQQRIKRIDTFTLTLLDHISLCNPYDTETDEFCRAQNLIKTMPAFQSQKSHARKNLRRCRVEDVEMFEVCKLMCFEELE